MGPTASGKTDLALALCEYLPCEIISVDSAQVYRGMDIGTAKPSIEIRQICPHHLIDILDPAQSYSAGQFYEDTRYLMSTIAKRNHIPLLVGGTMLYFHTLRNGISFLPARDLAIRAKIEKEAEIIGWKVLHDRLTTLDPLSANHINPNDPQRIQRALEVYQLTGKPLSSLINSTYPSLPYNIIRVSVLPKERILLHHRIEQRFLAMLEKGFLEEVKNLFQRSDLNIKLASIRAVGYRQAWLYLQNKLSLSAMIDQAIIATRQMAKRQLTWLRREKDSLQILSEEASAKELYQKINKYL
ncbi:tRNA (adenosine(37)-N6)-dimethylallyltransferase MiaA [Candidatus Nitrosacidococcus sp. I8]|uniref:tRNA (adenosine(37)-N6)-dimethylallyltransferase MiaA n=1 Tax=Candidatus Nitrosacidococcus sp. I8 TaxID=2942908 RepID=UPI0039B6EF3C